MTFPQHRATSRNTNDEASWFDSIGAWALVVVLGWAPLPFGSARPWSWSLLGALAVLLLAIEALGEGFTRRQQSPWRQLTWPLVLWLVTVVWAALQIFPLGFLSAHHPLWDMAQQMLHQKVDASLSVAPEASGVRLFRLLTYAGFFLVAWQVGQRPAHAALVVKSVAFLGTLHSVYGLYEFSSRRPHIFWIAKSVYQEDVTSTFINRNSFATFAGMALIANLVLIADILMTKTDMRSRTTAFLSVLENLFGRARWPVLGALLTGSALLLSHSRGGTTATAIATLILLVLMLTTPSLRSLGLKWFGGITAIGAVATILLAGERLSERLDAAGAPDEFRFKINDAVIDAIRDNFWTGTGLGSFEFIFPMYQPPSMLAFVDLAHNDYLENILELGAPAAAILFISIGWLVVECFLGTRRRRKDALYPCLAVAVSALVIIHAFFDFSLQIPAVSITYAALLGVGVAQSSSSRRPAY